ncbi:MAG TPA: glycosyltransferase family 2 protein [Acidobacteriota bacterium]|nr:glycosyltransferase family 2 protein [Acidobacteriota bacterium]
MQAISKNFSVSVILPVTNETFSLKETVDIISASCGNFVEEYLIVTCNKTTEESRRAIVELESRQDSKIVVHHQTLPFLGGAIREAFDLCRGSHVLMMASDLETDPNLVPIFLEEARQNPDMIVTGTRWAQGGGFEGYNPLKRLFNYVFQKFFSLLYGANLTDMTYGYRIFPATLVQSIQWEELRHAFLFETLLKPLRLGVKVKEIPAVWSVRKEGESQNSFFRNFEYFPIGLKVRFRKKSKLLKRLA